MLQLRDPCLALISLNLFYWLSLRFWCDLIQDDMDANYIDLQKQARKHLSPPATLLVTQIQILLVDNPCEKQKELHRRYQTKRRYSEKHKKLLELNEMMSCRRIASWKIMDGDEKIAWLTLLCQRMLAPLQNVFALTVLKTQGLTLPIVSMLKQAFYVKIKIVY
ncbi:7497_t:CDS:2 [Entrophospora sp. SA101]|nr:7497_t:CDS:2 [Entrophospora sp. SA101]